MGKRWTTDEEALWLEAKIPDYVEAQKKKGVSKFYINTQTAWFNKFSERKKWFPDVPETQLLAKEQQSLLEAKVQSRKKQIVSWFERNGNPSRRRDTRDTLKPFIKSFELLQSKSKDDLGKKSQRLPQRVVVYQQMFSDKIKAAVDEEAKKVGATIKEEIFKIRRNLSQSMLNAESPEVQDKITEEIERVKAERQKEAEKEAEQLEKVDEKVEPTPEEYAKAVAALPNALELALKSMSDTTGWVIYAVAAGPYGPDNGNIWQQEYYVGPTNQAGYNFRKAYANFDKGFFEPFSEHVHNCFPPDVRAARVVKKTAGEERSNNQVAQSTTTANPVISNVLDTARTAQQEETPHQAMPCDGMPQSDADSDDVDQLTSLVAKIQQARKDAHDQGPAEHDGGLDRPTSVVANFSHGNQIPEDNPGEGTGGNPSPSSDVIRPASPDHSILPSIPSERSFVADNGAPSEPIEMAFIRTQWPLPKQATPEQVSGEEPNTEACDSVPEPQIDPALLPPMDPSSMIANHDYMISGAQLGYITPGDTPQLADDRPPLQMVTTHSINGSQEPVPVPVGEFLTAQEKRHHTMAANKLKRKQLESQEHAQGVQNQENQDMDRDVRKRRNIQLPARYRL